jgi:hypothetical protein
LASWFLDGVQEPRPAACLTKGPRTNNLIGLLLMGRHRPIRDGISPLAPRSRTAAAGSSPPIHAPAPSLLSLGLPPRLSPCLRFSAVRSRLRTKLFLRDA